MKIQFLVFISSLNVVLGAIPWYSQEHPLLAVNIHHYDKSIIFQQLQNAFEEMYQLPKYNHAKLYLGDAEHERECLRGTEVMYYAKTFGFLEKYYEASECRINMNQQYQAVLSPTTGIESFVHQVEDPTLKDLETKVIERVDKQHVPALSQLQFYDFGSLNYNIECLVQYQEVAQIKLKELDLQVELQKVITVPEACGFSRFDAEFDGSYASSIKIQIPVNGTFVCQQGRTSTCKKSMAEMTNARYKLFSE